MPRQRKKGGSVPVVAKYEPAGLYLQSVGPGEMAERKRGQIYHVWAFGKRVRASSVQEAQAKVLAGRPKSAKTKPATVRSWVSKACAKARKAAK